MLFKLFDLELAFKHSLMSKYASNPTVLVFAGSMDDFESVVFPRFHDAKVHGCLTVTKLYGLAVHEVKSHSVVLVGCRDFVDRVLADETLLWQAHLMAYPASCPQCRGALLPVTVECGGTRWNGICQKCSTVYYVNKGILFIYDLKTREFVEAAPAQQLSGSPSDAASKPVPPDADSRPETWRDRPSLF